MAVSFAGAFDPLTLPARALRPDRQFVFIGQWPREWVLVGANGISDLQ